jgi:CRISPR-associated protein Cmr2
MNQLLICSIGPVQDFIAAARRSRDLWFGSWLLSELSKAAARAIAELESPASLIFPAPLGKDDLVPNSNFSVANKILTQVSHPPGEVAAAAEEALRKRLAAIAADALRNVHAPFDRQTAADQIAGLVEFFWVALPLARPEDYAATRARLEGLMAARKVTREFGPVTWGQDTPKSSLDGQRESVIPETAYDQFTERALYVQYGVRRGERLDGVGLLKRHGQRGQDSRFFSTSHVAALPLLKRLTPDKQGDLDRYLQVLRDLDLPTDAFGDVPGAPHPVFDRRDGHLLFEERLAEYLDEGPLGDARKALQTFLKAAFGEERPLPYYALLRADGDRMGKAINRIETPEKHRELSQKLAAFANEAREIVEAEEGWLIYSGGDDVLAFVPLHTALSCAKRLADAFANKLQGFTDAEGHAPTLSAGVAISHHLDPLSDALELARGAEREAKKSRNALAVTVSKRSGVDRTVSGVWGTLDRRLALFTGLHLADAVPDGAAYELELLGHQLQAEESDKRYLALQQAQAAEAVRILGRKQPHHGQEKKLANDILKVLTEMLQGTKPAEMQPDAAERSAVDTGERSRSAHGKLVTVDQLGRELVVARIFTDACRQAGIMSAKEQDHADMDH